MRKALTSKTLEAQPQPKRYEVHDVYCPGMSVRVSTQDRRSSPSSFDTALRKSA